MIAADLNREGIPLPFGGEWAASTINGNLKRRGSFLYNDAYIGLLFFHRLQMIRIRRPASAFLRPNCPQNIQAGGPLHTTQRTVFR